MIVAVGVVGVALAMTATYVNLALGVPTLARALVLVAIMGATSVLIARLLRRE